MTDKDMIENIYSTYISVLATSEKHESGSVSWYVGDIQLEPVHEQHISPYTEIVSVEVQTSPRNYKTQYNIERYNIERFWEWNTL